MVQLSVKPTPIYGLYSAKHFQNKAYVSNNALNPSLSRYTWTIVEWINENGKQRAAALLATQHSPLLLPTILSVEQDVRHDPLHRAISCGGVPTTCSYTTHSCTALITSQCHPVILQTNDLLITKPSICQKDYGIYMAHPLLVPTVMIYQTNHVAITRSTLHTKSQWTNLIQQLNL